MASQGELIPRRLTTLVDEALFDTRVVAINGARQTGKSTLARLTATARPGTAIRLLDDPATMQAAHDDPVDFVEHDGLMVIDEAQLVPDLFRAIKVAVDTNPQPGQSFSPAHPRSSPCANYRTHFRGGWRSSNCGRCRRAR